MATANKAMNDMMRTRHREIADLPIYEGPSRATERETATEEAPKPEAPKKEFTVKAPGEPSTGEQFEYEPFVDIPGAWVVYPPGVPCDDNEYRVTMDEPAAAEDFEGMQRAIDNRAETTPEPPLTEKNVEPGQDFPQFNA